MGKRLRAPLRFEGERARGERFGALVALAGVLALAAPALAADPFSTDWAASAKSQARLVAGGGELAGFEIRLAPGAITYWRDPGDSGLPPALDFSGSDNVAKVEPVFPAPKRIAEADGSEALGYDGGVVIPLRIAPRDPSKPITLALHANYAVCEKICLPAEARLALTLSNTASPYASLVDAALAAAPRAVPAKDFGDLEPSGAESWRFCAPHGAGPPRDLFVEAPADWWVTSAPSGEAGRDCFKLTLREKPKGATFPVALRLTLTGGPGAIETTAKAAEPK
jgi:DsbC/DsbD-like thiol-disulfide interchange protein